MTTTSVEKLYAEVFPDTPLSSDADDPICDLLSELEGRDPSLLTHLSHLAVTGGSVREWLQQIVINSAGAYANGRATVVEETYSWIKAYLDAAEFLARVLLDDPSVDADAPYFTFAGSRLLDLAGIENTSATENIAATAISYIVGEPDTSVSTLPAEVIASRIGYVANHLPEIEQILSTLKKRRACDQGTIEILLANKVAPLRVGGL